MDLYSQERFDAVRASLGQTGPIQDMPDLDQALAHRAVLERLVAAREAYHLERYGRWEDTSEIARLPSPNRGQGFAPYLERTLGDAAFVPGKRLVPSQRRRQTRQKMHREIEEGIGRDDGHGTSLT